MNPFLLVGLSLAASAVVYGSVLFLEPEKASFFKAITVNVVLLIASNIERSVGLMPEPMVQWAMYVVGTAICIRALYKLKPMNSITVGSCYVAGSYVLAYAFAV